MSNSSVPIPKYRKHKASGQAIVTLAGRDRYLGPHGTKISKLEYDRLVGEWLASGRPTSELRTPSEMLLKQLILAFWKFAQTEYVKESGEPVGTHLKYRPGLKLLRERYGHTRAIDFGPLALKALRQAMVDRGNSRRYINETIRRIVLVFKWAVSEQLLDEQVYRALATVRGLKKGKARELPPTQPVDAATVDATLPFLPTVVADMVRIQRLTGARPGEICRMRPGEIDTDGDVWKYRPADHKTKHLDQDRVIFIGRKAQVFLRPYLSRDPLAYCFSPAESEQKRRTEKHQRRKTPLQRGNRPGSNRRPAPTRPAGDCYTNDSYRRAVHRACELAFKMPAALHRKAAEQSAASATNTRDLATQWRAKHLWSPNQLRHSAATEIRREFGLAAAQVTLGHRRVETTQRYAEPDRTLGENVAKAVG